MDSAKNANAAKNTTDWKELDRRILAEINIQSAYEAAGLRISGSRESESGWVSCHAIGREDRNPSAGINVSTGPLRGRYKDMGSGESLSMWDAMVALGVAKDWREAKAELASRTSVELNGVARRPQDFFDFSSLSIGTAIAYARRKKGISRESLHRCGGRFAIWPERVRVEDRQYLIAFPMWGPDLMNADPEAFHCCGDLSQPVRVWQGKDKPPTKSKTMQKGGTGLMNDWAAQHWDQARIIWVVEGLTDMLCLQSLLGSRTDHVVTSLGGCNKTPQGRLVDLFAGKDVRVVFDVDPPSKDFPTGAGHSGAVRFVSSIVEVAESVRNVRLPYVHVSRKHDLRDWVIEGDEETGVYRKYDELLKLSEQFPTLDSVKLKTEQAKSRQTGVITNAVAVPVEGGGVKIEPMPLNETIDQMNSVTGGWPKMSNSGLFVDFGPERGRDRIQRLSSADELFGYFHSVAKCEWFHKQGCITKREFYSALYMQPVECESISSYEHFPERLPMVHYAVEDPVSDSNGGFIDRFLDFFPASSEIDRSLLLSMVLTLFWGGPKGSRPAFLLTTTKKPGQGGTGSGKSTTAQYIANLVGGATSITRCESAQKITTRLLTEHKGSGSRVLLLDNIKTEKFAWSDLESLITKDEISGHKLYQGNASIPNYFTWILTLNSPSLGTDIANRCIPVELLRPAYSPRWQLDVEEYIRDHIGEIVSEAGQILTHGEKGELQNRIRWGVWANEVLSRVPHCQEAHDVVVARQQEFNTESEESTDITQTILHRVLNAGVNPVKEPAFVPSKILAAWISEEMDEKVGPRKLHNMVRREVTEGRMLNIEYTRTRSTRGYVFYLGAMVGNPDWGTWEKLYSVERMSAFGGYQEGDEVYESAMEYAGMGD